MKNRFSRQLLVAVLVSTSVNLVLVIIGLFFPAVSRHQLVLAAFLSGAVTTVLLHLQLARRRKKFESVMSEPHIAAILHNFDNGDGLFHFRMCSCGQAQTHGQFVAPCGLKHPRPFFAKDRARRALRLLARDYPDSFKAQGMAILAEIEACDLPETLANQLAIRKIRRLTQPRLEPPT